MHITAIGEASAAVATECRQNHRTAAALHVCNTSELLSVPISKNSPRWNQVGCVHNMIIVAARLYTSSLSVKYCNNAYYSPTAAVVVVHPVSRH